MKVQLSRNRFLPTQDARRECSFLNFENVDDSVTLEEALMPLQGIFPVGDYLCVASMWVEERFNDNVIPHGLTADEAGAVYLYTIEQSPRV
jgi:hypothetical protein